MKKITKNQRICHVYFPIFILRIENTCGYVYAHNIERARENKKKS